jgi:hypothetical protein
MQGLPALVKIGACIYTISCVDQETLTDVGRWAEINYRLREIHYGSTRPERAQAEDIIHEILHAIFDDIGLDWGKKDEEKMTSRLAPRLAALIADNPELIERLTDALTDRAPVSPVNAGRLVFVDKAYFGKHIMMEDE